MNIKTVKLLASIGVTVSVRGYNYLKLAIDLIQKDPEIQYQLTKGLYPTIATLTGSTPSRVERAIRHCIELVYNKPGAGVRDQPMLTPNDSGKLTNGQSLAALVEIIRLEEAEEQYAKETT